MATKDKKTQTSEQQKKKRKILMGVLIPFGTLVATAAIVTPICVTCANKKTSEQGIQVDEINWKEAMMFIYDMDVSSNYTADGSNDGNKTCLIKVDGDNQYFYGESSESKTMEKTFFKKVNTEYKKYESKAATPKWETTTKDKMIKYEMFYESFGYMVNIYSQFTFKDGIYTFQSPSPVSSLGGTPKIEVKLIKVGDKTRLSSFQMSLIETGQIKGWYKFSNFGNTKIDDMPN